jgi:hypothetical protein
VGPKEDEFIHLIDSNLRGLGFSRLPTDERPYTYRSGKTFSTIDYAFVRNIAVQNFAVAR